MKKEIRPNVFEDKTFHLSGLYSLERADDGSIETINLYINNRFYPVKRGRCNAVPIPDGEIFLYLPPLPPSIPSGPANSETVVDTNVDSFYDYFQSGMEWDEEFSFDTVFSP